MNVDKKNSEFWKELCGTNMYKQLGLKEIDENSLKFFDEEYFKMYPYLKTKYLNQINNEDEVLEIGLGFGTLGNYLFDKCKRYTGIDISEGPVLMMKKRIEYLSKSLTCISTLGNGTNLDFQDNSFDFVVSCGVLHHTGKLKESINEVYRVLKPNGKFLMMIYRKPTILMRIVLIMKILKNKPKKLIEYGFSIDKLFKFSYDHNQNDESTPYTDFTSIMEIKSLLEKFNSSEITIENHTLSRFRNKGRLSNNKLFLKLFGCDLYSISVK